MTPDPPMRLLPALLALALAAPAAAQTVEDGFKAYDAGDYETAKSIFLPLADAGDPRAMNAVGLLYANGNALPRDRKQACDWYEKAALAGYRSAQGNFASCYGQMGGRTRDLEKAIEWNERAALRGDVESQVELLRLYREKDPQAARKWGEEAAKAGSITARFLMEEYRFPYSGPRPTRFEKYCYVLMVGILKKPRNFCDRPIVYQEPPLTP